MERASPKSQICDTEPMGTTARVSKNYQQAAYVFEREGGVDGETINVGEKGDRHAPLGHSWH